MVSQFMSSPDHYHIHTGPRLIVVHVYRCNKCMCILYNTYSCNMHKSHKCIFIHYSKGSKEHQRSDCLLAPETVFSLAFNSICHSEITISDLASAASTEAICCAVGCTSAEEEITAYGREASTSKGCFDFALWASYQTAVFFSYIFDGFYLVEYVKAMEWASEESTRRSMAWLVSPVAEKQRKRKQSRQASSGNGQSKTQRWIAFVLCISACVEIGSCGRPRSSGLHDCFPQGVSGRRYPHTGCFAAFPSGPGTRRDEEPTEDVESYEERQAEDLQQRKGDCQGRGAVEDLARRSTTSHRKTEAATRGDTGEIASGTQKPAARRGEAEESEGDRCHGGLGGRIDGNQASSRGYGELAAWKGKGEGRASGESYRRGFAAANESEAARYAASRSYAMQRR